jgi:hypothetical protein
LHTAPRRGSANDKDKDRDRDGKERDKDKEKDREAAADVDGDVEGEGADDGVEVFVADEAVDFGGLKQVCVLVFVLVYVLFPATVPSVLFFLRSCDQYQHQRVFCYR